MDLITYDNFEKLKAEHTNALYNKNLNEEANKLRKKELEIQKRNNKEIEELLVNSSKLSIDDLRPELTWGEYSLTMYCHVIKISTLIDKLTDNTTDLDSKLKLELYRLLVENKEYFNSLKNNKYCVIMEASQSNMDKVDLEQEYRDILIGTTYKPKRFLMFNWTVAETQLKYDYFIVFLDENSVYKRAKKITLSDKQLKVLAMEYEFISSYVYEMEYYTW